MFPNEILLEIISFLNKNDLARLIFTNKNIYEILNESATIKFYQDNNEFMLEESMCSIFIFKTIYYSKISIDKKDLLKIASRNGHLEVVKFLVENRANLNTDDNFFIWWARANGHLDVVKFLMANGGDRDVMNN